MSRHYTGSVTLAALAIAASWTAPGHADAPPGRYTTTAATVYDTKTNLTWERASSVGMSAWDAAKTHCSTLAVDGKMWRLPSMKELQTIVDRTRATPAIDPTAFPNTPDTPSTAYWTSSPSAAAPASDAWIVDFGDGSSSTSGAGTPLHVRCVVR